MELLSHINNNFNVDIIPAYSYLDLHGRKRDYLTEDYIENYKSTTSQKISVEDTVTLLWKVRAFLTSNSLELVDIVLSNKNWLNKIVFVSDQSYRVVGFNIHRDRIVWCIDWYAVMNHYDYFGSNFFSSITDEKRYDVLDRAEQIFISFDLFSKYFINSKEFAKGFLGEHYYSFIR